MSNRIPHQGKLLLAALAAASLAVPRAKLTTSASGASPAQPGGDTAYGEPYGDSTSGGTGMGPAGGLGGSSLDSAYGRDTLYGHDTLWSSPYDQPATPGTGLPNSSGAGEPGAGGSGMGNDSSRNSPGTPSLPGNNGATPEDSTGGPDMMERG